MLRCKLIKSAVAVIVTLAICALSLSAGERQESLRAALEGTDRITVKDVEHGVQEERTKPFEFSKAAKIADLISVLDFDEDESGFYCRCSGDATVTFYSGDKKLAELSHHHGQSLRWNGGNWKGDSQFTVEAAKAWRGWFNAHGEPRFEKMHQQALAAAKRAQDINERFLRAFNPRARELFVSSGQDGSITFTPQESSKDGDVELSPSAKNLIMLYPDQSELAIALARALGSLTVTGAQESSWSVSSSREQLVIECAKTLNATTFRKVLESDDQEVLAGAARLFFFEGLAALLSNEERAKYAAKLARLVLDRDKCGNAAMAVRALGSFRSPETIALLEDVARGAIKTPTERSDYKDEPSSRSAACLLLAKFGSKNASELSKAAEKAEGIDKIDQAALRIARSFSGERGLLDSSIFEIDSFTIGFGALSCLEREGDKAALDAIIMGGTQHSWAAIREESVLTVERLTGRKWFQDQKNERAEWHGKEIREWWDKNRDSYALPESRTGKSE